MGFFRRMFRPQPKLDPIDLSILHTDLHSHLIPGIDDGSKTMEDSIAMLKKFIELGFKKVITTPHIMSDFYKNTPAIITSGLEDLRKAAKEENLDANLTKTYQALLTKIQEEKIIELDKNKEEIRYKLTEELVKRYYYIKGVYQQKVVFDKTILKAVSILTNDQQYNSILN